MAHLVADAVGAPAQRQLRQVARADHQPPVLVGEPEQEIGAQPRLHVLERHVVDGLSRRVGMAHLLQHLERGRADVDLVRGDPQRLHQRPGVALGGLARREPRQGVGQHIHARHAERVHRLAGHDQRFGGVEAAGDADHQLSQPRGAQPLHQPLHLDVPRLVAGLPQRRLVVGHVGEAGDLARQGQWLGGGRKVEGDAAEGGRGARAVAEAAGADALGADAGDVDVGVDHAGLGGEARRLGQQRAQLEHRGVSVPGEIGGRFAGSRRGIGHRRQAPRRLGAEQLPPSLGLAEHDVGGREVHKHLRAGQRRLAAGRLGDPAVLAHLHVEAERRRPPGREDQVGPERRRGARQGDLAARNPEAGSEPAPLIELAVVGQVALGHDAQHPSGVDRDGAVEQPPAPPERRPDAEHGRELARRLRQARQRRFHPVEQRVLQVQVVDGVSAEAELRKHHQRGARLVARARQPQRLGDVPADIGGRHGGGRHAHPHEAVGIGAGEGRAGGGHAPL